MMHLAALTLVLAMTPQDASDHGDHAEVRKPLPSAEAIAELPADGGPEFNRLVFSKSPYLLQHARNPVDWHEWGPEAFALAKERDVPVFLSIGYSTCHWCHVMEHESFEDDEVAKLMNDAFVCIKLDREERPDIDQLYMTVTQAMTGSGGWPMTVVMTSDKQPFFAGTYFPKSTRGQRHGMLELVPAISTAWSEQRKEIFQSAQQITEQLAARSGSYPGAMLGAATLEKAEATLRTRFDEVHGGFGTTRKFPVPHELRFLLRRYDATGDASTLKMVTKTLEAWHLGGIFDQVGLGMHRYSTDPEFLLPHFEKMLYDQALCALAYIDAWQVTKDPAHERAVREILAYVTRDMTSPEGGFYSAEDADSEGEEGLFYLWKTSEIEAVLKPEDAAWVNERFRIAKDGNYRDEATRAMTGRNIPHLGTPLTNDEQARWEPLRQSLFASREARIHPLKDDKVLTDWNGLAIEAFARAGRAFGDEALVEHARRAAAFLRANLVRGGGEDGELRLLKRWRSGEAGLDGMLDDYAYVASGFLALFEATHDPRDLAFARSIVDAAIAHFWDEESGGFFLSPDDGEALIVRAKEAYDGARPSGNSSMANAMMRLARMTGEMAYEERAIRTVESFSRAVEQNPSSHTQMLGVIDMHARTAREIVVVGDANADDTAAMLHTLAQRYAPNDVVVLRPAGEADAPGVQPLVQAVPYVGAQRQIDGKATVYVCSDFACKAPVTSLEAMLSLLSPPSPQPSAAGAPGSAPEKPAKGADASGGK